MIPHGWKVEHVPRFEGDAHRFSEMRVRRRAHFRCIRIPSSKGDVSVPVSIDGLVHTQLKSLRSSISMSLIFTLATNISGGLEISLIHARLEERGQEGEVLSPRNLDVDILVVVAVQRRHGARVTYPHVDGIGVSLQCNPGKCNALLHLRKECYVFVPQIVIFCVLSMSIGLQAYLIIVQAESTADECDGECETHEFAHTAPHPRLLVLAHCRASYSSLVV